MPQCVILRMHRVSNMKVWVAPCTEILTSHFEVLMCLLKCHYLNLLQYASDKEVIVWTASMLCLILWLNGKLASESPSNNGPTPHTPSQKEAHKSPQPHPHRRINFRWVVLHWCRRRGNLYKPTPWHVIPAREENKNKFDSFEVGLLQLQGFWQSSHSNPQNSSKTPKHSSDLLQRSALDLSKSSKTLHKKRLWRVCNLQQYLLQSKGRECHETPLLTWGRPWCGLQRAHGASCNCTWAKAGPTGHCRSH